MLRGKHKPIFTPHVDTGDYIVVVNADKIKVSGAKKKATSFIGATRVLQEAFDRLLLKNKLTSSYSVIEHAVRGMLPKGPLGRKMFKKLKIYNRSNSSSYRTKSGKFELKVKGQE